MWTNFNELRDILTANKPPLLRSSENASAATVPAIYDYRTSFLQCALLLEDAGIDRFDVRRAAQNGHDAVVKLLLANGLLATD